MRWNKSDPERPPHNPPHSRLPIPTSWCQIPQDTPTGLVSLLQQVRAVLSALGSSTQHQSGGVCCYCTLLIRLIQSSTQSWMHVITSWPMVPYDYAEVNIAYNLRFATVTVLKRERVLRNFIFVCHGKPSTSCLLPSVNCGIHFLWFQNFPEAVFWFFLLKRPSKMSL